MWEAEERFSSCIFLYRRTAQAGEFKNLGGLYILQMEKESTREKPDFKTAFLFLEDYDETAIPPWAMRLRLEPEEFES